MQSNRSEKVKRELDGFETSLNAFEKKDIINISVKLATQEVIDRHLKKLNEKLLAEANLKGILRNEELTRKLLSIKNISINMFFQFMCENKIQISTMLIRKDNHKAPLYNPI